MNAPSNSKQDYFKASVQSLYGTKRTHFKFCEKLQKVQKLEKKTKKTERRLKLHFQAFKIVLHNEITQKLIVTQYPVTTTERKISTDAKFCS